MNCALMTHPTWRNVTCEQCDYAADCEIRKEYLELKRIIRRLNVIISMRGKRE